MRGEEIVGAPRVRVRSVLVPIAIAQMLIWVTIGAGITPDSPGLLADADSIVTPGATTYFLPGYPALLGLLRCQHLVPIPTMLIGLQHAMQLLMAWSCFCVLRTVLPAAHVRIGVVFASLLPGWLLLGNCILTEPLAVPAMVGCFHCALLARGTGHKRHAVLAGLLAGIVGVTRLLPMFAVLPAAGLLLLTPWPQRRLRLALLTLASAAAVVILPLLWFGLHSGHFALSNAIGGHWFNRVVNEQGLGNRDGPATKRVLAVVGSLPRHGSEHTVVRTRLEAAGWSYAAANDLLGVTAGEAVRGHYGEFVVYTITQAARQLFTNPELPVGDEDGLRIAALQRPAPLGPLPGCELALRRLRGAQALLWPLLAFVGFAAGIVLGWRRRSIVLVAWLSVPALTLLGQAAVEQALPRYSVPLVPFLAPLSLAAVYGCMRTGAASPPAALPRQSPDDRPTSR